MLTLQPYVKLLGKMDHRLDAWKTSRPKFTEENLNFNKVAEMDLSLNSMLVYTFEMRSSVIMRDLIFSLRPMGGWALSTRSMPIDEDTVRLSSEYYDRIEDGERVTEMLRRMRAGESRDKIRDILPLTVSSTYTFTIDYRVLISFIKNIEIVSPMLFQTYGIEMLMAADIGYDEYKLSTIGSSLEYYMIQDSEKVDGIQEAGNMIFGHYEMKAALASQFLRQHYSKIKTGLWNIVSEQGAVLDLNQGSMIPMAFYIDKQSYSRLISMRCHWVIDWSLDMWGGIAKDFIEKMTVKEFWEFIPNGNSKPDPYWADVYNRVLHEDPGIPCPIMCEWPAMLAERLSEIGDNPILDKYFELVGAGYIKDNPENEHRVKYLELSK